jgi:hypothetical protein
VAALADHQIHQSDGQKRPPDCAEQDRHQRLRLKGRRIKDDSQNNSEHRSDVPCEPHHQSGKGLIQHAVATILEKGAQQVFLTCPRVEHRVAVSDVMAAMIRV